MTTTEAAEYLGVSGAMIRSLVKRGHLSAVEEQFGPGTRLLIPWAEIEARKRAKKRGKLPTGGRPKKD